MRMAFVFSVVLLIVVAAAGLAGANHDANRSQLVISTLFTAKGVGQYLASDKGIDQAIDNCRKINITKVYIECYRGGYWAERKTLEHARDRFKAAGFEVSGGVTTTQIGKKSTGKPYLSCYTDMQTQEQLQKIFEYAASMFDEIMIDDFFYTDCECSECENGRSSPAYKRFHADSISWADYRCDLMVEVSKERVLKPAKAVNPNVKIIIKYPQWYDRFHKRGYEVVRQSAEFDRIWVGTETRDPNSERFGKKNQYEAYYIMRWLGEIGGQKCGGGWFDRYDTSPTTYLEQARQTVLGGAKEMVLFSFGSLQEENGPENVEALRKELPGLIELAKLVRGKPIRGIAAPKPPNSEPYDEQYIYDFVGMMGLPLVPTAGINPDARAAFLPVQAFKDPDIKDKIQKMLAAKKPVLITDGLANRLNGFNLADKNLQILDVKGDPYNLHKLAREDLKAIRDKMLAPFGVKFDAPNKVALYLFGNDLVVIENFNDEAVTASLEITDMAKAQLRVVLPADGTAQFSRKGRRVEFEQISPRTLVAIEYR